MSAPSLREPAAARTIPSGDAIRKADAAMAATERGECPFCLPRTIDEEGFCQSEECR